MTSKERDPRIKDEHDWLIIDKTDPKPMMATRQCPRCGIKWSPLPKCMGEWAEVKP